MYILQEEAGETVSSDSNGVSMWLCPLCQQGQPDRDGLSLHLTGKHSVLPACLNKLLDIVSHLTKCFMSCVTKLYNKVND